MKESDATTHLYEADLVLEEAHLSFTPTPPRSKHRRTGDNTHTRLYLEPIDKRIHLVSNLVEWL